MIITIDGPTASGKSTVAQMIAKKLGFLYLSSGWLYRAVAYLLVRDYGYDEEKLLHPQEVDVVACLDMKRLLYTYDADQGGTLYYDGENITSFLKDYTVDRLVAIISPLPFVRMLVTHAQKERALHAKGAVVEGRDTGSVVFPDADKKFFLTASLEVRAARWKKDQALRGNNFSLDEAIKAIHERDVKDLQRKHSPLIVPENATYIDCSTLSIDEVVTMMLQVIQKK